VPTDRGFARKHDQVMGDEHELIKMLNFAAARRRSANFQNSIL